MNPEKKYRRPTLYGLGALATIGGGVEAYKHYETQAHIEAKVDDLSEQTNEKKLPTLARDAPVFLMQENAVPSVDTKQLFSAFQKKMEELFKNEFRVITQNKNRDFEHIYIAYADQFEHIVNFDEGYTTLLAAETGRTPEQMRFVANVVRDGFYGKLMKFGEGISERHPETNDILDIKKHADWYDEQYRTAIGFADRVFERVQDTHGEQKENIETDIGQYIKTELIVRAYVKQIKNSLARDRKEFVIEGIKAVGGEKAQAPTLDVLKKAIEKRNHVLHALFQHIPKRTNFESEQLQAYITAATWKEVQQVLSPHTDDETTLHALQEISAEYENQFSLFQQYQQLDQDVAQSFLRPKDTPPKI